MGGGQTADRNLEIAGHVVALAAELGTTPAAVALAWVRDRPGVASVLIGPRTVAQLTDSLAGFTLELPPEAVARPDAASSAEAPARALPPVAGPRAGGQAGGSGVRPQE